MRIADVRAFPTSFPVPPEASVTLGIGRAVKRDSVVVKVTTDDGVIGWGESHHGRSPGAVAHHANTTLRELIVGMTATDVVGVWGKVYKSSAGHCIGCSAAPLEPFRRTRAACRSAIRNRRPSSRRRGRASGSTSTRSF